MRSMGRVRVFPRVQVLWRETLTPALSRGERGKSGSLTPP
jgi:hypothetical protein